MKMEIRVGDRVRYTHLAPTGMRGMTGVVTETDGDNGRVVLDAPAFVDVDDPRPTRDVVFIFSGEVEVM